jgi:hypothetical protein
MNFPAQFWENHNRKGVFLHELSDKKQSIGYLSITYCAPGSRCPIGGYTQGQSKVNALAVRLFISLYLYLKEGAYALLFLL